MTFLFRWTFISLSTFASLVPHLFIPVGSLSNYYDDDDDNDSVKKQLVLWAKQHPCTCITCFSTFLWCPLYDFDVKPSSACDVLWRTWTYGDKFSFLLVLKLDKVRENWTPEEIACIWQIERVQMDAIKFGRTQIHFLATFSLPSSSVPRKAVI